MPSSWPAQGAGVRPPGRPTRSELDGVSSDDAGPVLDAAAKQAYRERLRGAARGGRGGGVVQRPRKGGPRARGGRLPGTGTRRGRRPGRAGPQSGVERRARPRQRHEGDPRDDQADQRARSDPRARARDDGAHGHVLRARAGPPPSAGVARGHRLGSARGDALIAEDDTGGGAAIDVRHPRPAAGLSRGPREGNVLRRRVHPLRGGVRADRGGPPAGRAGRGRRCDCRG